MHGKVTATAQPNSIAPAAPATATAPPAVARPYGVAGELTPELIREWGPVLKPTGIGLLVTLHSFEETTPGHPYYGWAHCTQNALAAYLDTSQDTIARYSNLLQICGLLQVEEVETPRGKQKLYRVARGQAWPSLALLEYLVFDADTWTRKHAAWLAARLAPLGAETEIARLTGIMGRAYRVAVDARGLAGIIEGARLTREGSYRPRRAPAAQQPPLLPAAAATGDPLSASCGQGPANQQDESRSTGDPSASSGVGPVRVHRAGLCEVGSTGDPSASSGVGAALARAGAPPRESAPGGFADPCGPGEGPSGSSKSASGGVETATESARSGLAIRPIVNVESFNVKNERNDNANDASPAVIGTPSAPSGDDPDALLGWGVAALGDKASREWHRRCLTENGPERYRWAIDATLRAQAKGTVSNPGAYFTSLLRRRGGPPLPVPPPPTGPVAAPASPLPPAAAAEPPRAAPPLLIGTPRPAACTSLSTADCMLTWQAALIHLRIILPADDYARILRYAVLLELDHGAGWALLGLPADYMREQVERRLAGTIAQVLGQVCGTPVHVAAVVLPGQGRLAGAMPTLGEWLAQRAQPPAPQPAGS